MVYLPARTKRTRTAHPNVAFMFSLLWLLTVMRTAKDDSLKLEQNVNLNIQDLKYDYTEESPAL